ncbi:MAG TPA: family 16 glycoside hydrolase [Candidatus Saccharimonadales bacterium]|jgi:choline dehydrogenase-like flavoprotein|nr:family 16 glycoside hydrolase [Candidatus Saccharimonadales bacterium]
MLSTSPQRTNFTLDVLGRFICNGLDEALRSTDKSMDPDARPFDVVIIGGGSFGSVLASHIFSADQTHAHRILVLEAGPFLYPEHVQNLPPAFDSLDGTGVWGVPWVSDSPQSWNQSFPGLAFCLGGRSLFWGGWSPYFLESEILEKPQQPKSTWPRSVVRDLTENVLPFPPHKRSALADVSKKQSYLEQAADQIGTSETNDFINGRTHEVLAQRLFAGLKARSSATTELTGQVKDEKKLTNVLDLEAPLAVQSAGPRPGFFPFNKFNGVQLLIEAARLAQSEAESAAIGDANAKNVKKRLMVVDNAHVIRLESAGGRVVRIVTNQGTVDVPYKGRVFLAAGTIENTRIALHALPNSRGLIGRNLMAHLRSNLTFRVKRSDFDKQLDLKEHPELHDLQVSALFVKGIHKHGDGPLGHFHFQITASGAGALGTNSESQLFKKVPNIDELERFEGMTDDWIVITVRGIGEMEGDKTSPDPRSRVTLDATGQEKPFDYGQSHALVRIAPSDRDLALWNVMDKAAQEISVIFAGGGSIQYFSPSRRTWQNVAPAAGEVRDQLSSTHHESGTLWMGEDPATSVTDDLGRFHESENLHALGPCLLPTMGSPNPMLSGVALTRRTGDHLVRHEANALEDTFEYIFDGTDSSFSKWLQAGGGTFALIDGSMVAQPAGEIGLCYFSRPFSDFTLRLEFKLDAPDNNSGVFVRFRNPRLPVPDRYDPGISFPYNNQAWVGVDTGFEVQIDETARPDGADKHRTGAIYNIPTEGPSGVGVQKYHRTSPLRVGAWNEYEIEVVDQTYNVRLNGVLAATFHNTDAYRGKPNSADPDSGFIGFQCESGRVAFRNVRISTKHPRSLIDAEARVHLSEGAPSGRPSKSEKGAR